MSTDTVATQATPVDTLLQISGGAVLPRCLHAVANLGIADALSEAPQSAATLAAATGTNSGALERMLRLLSASGVFSHRDGLFGHTAASRLLRADHPQSMRALVRMFGLPAFWPVIGELEHSLRTGLPTAEKVLAGSVWGYLSSNAEASRIFDEAMTSKAYGQVAGVVGAYDFSAFGVIGDIGGGRGHLLQRVLMSAPGARGVLFDQQHVVEQASGVRSDRLTLQAGNFFKGDLPVCDAYLLMEVIHDWNDQDATKILRNVRSAAPAHSKLLIIEAIIAEDPGLSWPKTLDLWMLAIGGKQRTRQEYAELFANAGFSFTRQIDTQAGVSIIEGIPA